MNSLQLLTAWEKMQHTPAFRKMINSLNTYEIEDLCHLINKTTEYLGTPPEEK